MLNSIIGFFNSLIIILILSTSVTGQSVDSSQSRVVILRPSNDMGAFNRFTLIINDSLTLFFENNTTHAFIVQPGKFRYKAGKKADEESIDLDSGRTHYLLLQYSYGVWNSVPRVYEIKQEQAEKIMLQFKPKEIRNTIMRPVNRFGLFFGGGPGINDFPIIKTTDNEDVYIGFGGGYCLGAEVGSEISKYFDVSIGYRFMNRGLTPYLKNASMEFIRHALNVTPALIIPIQGGYSQRIKIGAGIDYYLRNTLIIETDKIPNGINDTWKYKPAIGYHFKLTYEVNLTEQFSMLLGGRYSFVNHRYASSKTFYPTTDNFISPNGDGFDLMLGVQYHF
jgi:hypothetical protein